MGVVRTAALVLTVLLLATACARGADEAGRDARGTTHVPETALTDYSEAERGWLAALGAWREGIDATLWDFGFVSTDDRIEAKLERGDEETRRYVRAFLEDLGRCSESFRADVGVSPTPRLRLGSQAIVTACEYLERGAKEDLSDLERGHDDPFLDGVFWIGGGRDRLWTSNRQILLRADGRRLIASGVPGESRVDVGLSDAANRFVQLVTFRLQVRCWSEEDWPDVVEELSAFTDGAVTIETVAWPSYLVGVHLSPWACTKLKELESDYAVEEDSARALVAFARALALFYGVRNEGRAECWAMQAADDVARALGVSRGDARALGRLYWERVFRKLPAELRSRECRSGGQFDIDPARSRWP